MTLRLSLHSPGDPNRHVRNHDLTIQEIVVGMHHEMIVVITLSTVAEVIPVAVLEAVVMKEAAPADLADKT